MTDNDAERANKIAYYILAHERVMWYELQDKLFNGDNDIDIRSIMGQVNKELGTRAFLQDAGGHIATVIGGLALYYFTKQ